MTQTLESITSIELAALEFLVEVDQPPRGPFRRGDAVYLKSMLVDRRRELVRARLEQSRNLRINDLREQGQRGSHSAQEPISDREIDTIVQVEINQDLDFIKRCMQEGKNPVAELHKFREK